MVDKVNNGCKALEGTIAEHKLERCQSQSILKHIKLFNKSPALISGLLGPNLAGWHLLRTPHHQPTAVASAALWLPNLG